MGELRKLMVKEQYGTVRLSCGIPMDYSQWYYDNRQKIEKRQQEETQPCITRKMTAEERAYYLGGQ